MDERTEQPIERRNRMRREAQIRYRAENPERVKESQARYYHKNAAKRKADSSAWRRERPWKNRETQIKSKFGLTPADYEKLFAGQGGVCAACLQPETAPATRGPKDAPRAKHLAVDHNHKTGRIRGLLCSTCNRAIGMLKDNAETFRRIVAYLERTAD